MVHHHEAGGLGRAHQRGGVGLAGEVAEADLRQPDPVGGQRVEVGRVEAGLDDDRPGQHLHAPRPEGRERALGRQRERLHAGAVARAPGQVHLRGRHHHRDAAVHRALDPAERRLARGPVAEHHVGVAVDEPGDGQRPARVQDDLGRLVAGVGAQRGHEAVLHQHPARAERRLSQAPADDAAQVADGQAAHRAARASSTDIPPSRWCRRPREATAAITTISPGPGASGTRTVMPS